MFCLTLVGVPVGVGVAVGIGVTVGDGVGVGVGEISIDVNSNAMSHGVPAGSSTGPITRALVPGEDPMRKKIRIADSWKK